MIKIYKNISIGKLYAKSILLNKILIIVKRYLFLNRACKMYININQLEKKR